MSHLNEKKKKAEKTLSSDPQSERFSWESGQVRKVKRPKKSQPQKSG